MALHTLRRDPIFRGPLLLIGATAKRSYVEVGDDTLAIRFGLAKEQVPLSKVASAEPQKWRMLYGIGVRIGPGGIAYVGSQSGVVHIALREPHRFRVFFGLRASFSGLYPSLDDPDAFLRDLQPRIGEQARGANSSPRPAP